ncbi:MAG TPA: HD domain-containing phosphohydrolase, partial [Burkholderiaceae bacterium]|nr:HD domain-containing phosphohydrolase [Burkholderiaceae bacterium]
IPLAARITALADVFDALTHARPYKRAWTVDDAVKEIEAQSGKHFDPELTPIFIALVRRLQKVHPDLDAYLGEPARKSAFIQARKNIANALQRESELRLLDVRR